MKTKQKRDYVAKLQIYDLTSLSNKDIRDLCKWLKDISESKVKADKMNADKVISYKLMK